MAQPRHNFFLVANDPCLDFVNTTAVIGGESVDLIDGFGRLVEWLGAAGLADAAACDALRRHSGGEAEATVAEARQFRAGLRRAAEAAADGGAVPASVVRAVNTVLRRGPRYIHLRGSGRAFEKTLRVDEWSPARLLVPVAEAAATLLAERDLARVKRCGNPACVLFFYDASKNQGRRWCSMEVCGNRMKVAAHHRRRREGA